MSRLILGVISVQNFQGLGPIGALAGLLGAWIRP